MSEAKWVSEEWDADAAVQMGREASIPPALAALLIARGVDNPDAIDRFLRPRLSELGDPMRLHDAPIAVDAIWKAIDAADPIVVYGDYDVDGVTSTAVLTKVLRHFGASVRCFLPDREKEGYGFSVAGFERCVAEGPVALIITVDCGTTSHEAVELAKSRDVDVIVTDHHEVAEAQAHPLALVNPKLGDDEGLMMLSGVGVVFKLSHALVKAAREQGRENANLDLRRFLDLVAVGTIADMVPLRGENRIFARHGLTVLSQNPCPGLRALREVSDSKGRADAYEVGFRIGPRINAAGRLGTADAALRLLLTEDVNEAVVIAADLDAANKERQTIERKIVDEAMADLDARFDAEQDVGLVVAKEGWHKGVVGIVASRIARRFHRPSIVIAIDGDEARGSCRSIDGLDMVEALGDCAELLTQYGGHRAAAGVTLPTEKLEAFSAAFNAACRKRLTEEDLRRRVNVDAWLQPGDVDRRFYDSMQQMEPFGTGNPRPQWGLRGVSVVGQPRTVGTGHLKMLVAAGGTQWDSIGFGLGDREIPDGTMDLAFNLTLNAWQGRETLQLQLNDFRATRD